MTLRVLSASTALVSSSFALMLTAGSSFAVTPEEVWENWKAMTTGTGAEVVVGSETREGDTLVITGLESRAKTPEGDVIFSSRLDRVTLKDSGNGTVTVTLPESYPVTVLPEGEDSQALVELTVSQPGNSIVASGTAEATTVKISAPKSTLSLTKALESDGTPIDAKLDVTLADFSSTYLLSPAADATSTMDYSLTTGALTLTGEAKNASRADESASLKLEIASLTGGAKGVFLSEDKMKNLSEALRDGFAIDSKVALGATSYAFTLNEASGQTNIKGTLGGADLNVLLDAAQMNYGFGLKALGLDIDAPSSGMPPMSGTFGELAFGFAMPVAQTDTPQPFSLLTRLVDVTISDNLWSMVDPSGQFGRDPATLILDLKGTGKWLVDVMDPRVQSGELPSPEEPVEINSADLSELLVKLGGAEVTGTGGLTFDNSDLTTWEGFPAPTGKLTFTLTQVNALLDKLVAMGLIPEQEVMGIRMGLAMFAKPGAGPDQLTSEVEFRGANLFVNGQQLR